MDKGAFKTGPQEGIVIFGFGSQGRAQAENLRQSGLAVSVFLRPKSPRIGSAKAAGFTVLTDPAEAAGRAGTAVLLLPDSEQPDFYMSALDRNLPRGAALVFAHGFCVHYGGIAPRPDLDVLLAAPLAHGDALRRDFAEERSTPCVLAVAQNSSGEAWQRLRGYAGAVCGEGPFIESSFAEEVETDLFAEQAVLCGGMPELVRAAFDTLANAGYDQRIAYVSCLKELRAIADLMWREAIAGMRSRISDTARYGALTRGPRIVNESVRAELERVLAEIRSGAFAKELAEERERGFSSAREALAEEERHPIERLHRAMAGESA